MAEIKLTYYRNSRNARKLDGLVQRFTAFDLPDDLQEPCSVIINKDSTADDLTRFVNFWPVVKKYKETVLFMAGAMRTREQAESVMDWIRCYCMFDNAVGYDYYCHVVPNIKSRHGWGCKWLCSVLRHGRFGWHNGIHWYNIGPFMNGVQYIDKTEIKEMLKAESENKGLGLCPKFSLKKAFYYVDQLPDQIDPRTDFEWVYAESGDIADPHEIVGVEPKPVDVFADF